MASKALGVASDMAMGVVSYVGVASDMAVGVASDMAVVMGWAQHR